MSVCRCATSKFRGGFMGLRHFDKHFLKNTRKVPAEFFLLDPHKTTYWMEILTRRWTQSGPFFPKPEDFFFWSSKKGRGGLSLCCVPVIVDDNGSVSLNIPKYLWKCLNKLSWLCQTSEYAWSSYLIDSLLKMSVSKGIRVVNVARLSAWIEQTRILM